MTDIRYPNITGRTPEEQISQIKGYLHSLADQLNFQIRSLERENEELRNKLKNMQKGHRVLIQTAFRFIDF